MCVSCEINLKKKTNLGRRKNNSKKINIKNAEEKTKSKKPLKSQAYNRINFEKNENVLFNDIIWVFRVHGQLSCI